MYAIVGATGNTGRAIAEALLARGQKVRAIGRDAGRLRPLAQRGAEPFVGSVEDAEAMQQALRGATAVYTMVPPNLRAEDLLKYQHRVGKAFATALAESGVRHVVNLSSIGAHLSQPPGPIAGLRDVEQQLSALPGVHVLHLRPGYFMENLLWNKEMITTQGINGTPLRADLSLPMIATRDIAAEAVERLVRLDFSGKTAVELLGPRDLSMTEVTHILGRIIGKPDLIYVQFSYPEAEQAMTGMGMSADVARALVDMYRALNEGRLGPAESRSARNTTPTPFETFGQVFARAGCGCSQYA